MEDLDLFPDEGEEAAQGEGSNRLFIILVAAMIGVMVLALCGGGAFYWFYLRPRQERMAQNNIISATNEAQSIAANETVTAVSPPGPTETRAPTGTPQPTATEKPMATPTPPAATATPAQAAEAVAEASPTPRPTATRQPTAAPAAGNQSSSESVPGTGIGALGGGALALGLLFLLVVVRRLRRAA
jgi:type IV secretory pathway VirB10-like protein